MRKPDHKAMRICGACIIAAVLSCSVAVTKVFAGNDLGQNSFSRILIEFFYEQGCSECAYVSDSVLPELEQRYAGFYTLERCDIGIENNYLKLVEYQNRLGILENEAVCVVVDRRFILNGIKAIDSDLLSAIDTLIGTRLENPSHYDSPQSSGQNGDEGALLERLNQFTFAGVAVAGLIDGINPCAIATLVFFISLLTVLKVKNRALIMVGCSFCLASFVTYLALGFGLLRVLYLFSKFPVLTHLIEAMMIGILVLLSLFSIRDALRYAKTSNSCTVTIQLPKSVKERIHRIMRSRLTHRNLVIGSLVTGTIVTALESVCTGQVYVPTLVFLAKSGQRPFLSACYLLVYNLMFIMPIGTTFVLVLKGFTIKSLITWSERNVVISKSALAFFFLSMAFLLILL